MSDVGGEILQSTRVSSSSARDLLLSPVCLLTCREIVGGMQRDTGNQRIGVKSETRRQYKSREVKEVVKNVSEEVSKRCRSLI